MDWIVQTLRANPSLAVFLTLGIGFFIGQLRFKSFSLGTVTSVLLVGVVVGQLDIPVPGPLKDVFFLLFLFAIGYSVGPQFFRALRGDGLKQVLFAVVVCVLCLLSTWGVALLMGYNVGEAVGLLAGSQTMSAAIGVGTDTIQSLSATAAQKQQWLGMIPVCYAVSYVYGTIGSAYVLANLGPWLLGGLKKVRAETAELEKKLNAPMSDPDPDYIRALRPVVFRAYKATAPFFAQPRTPAEVEEFLLDDGRRTFVERVRKDGRILDVAPGVEITISSGDEIVLSGRREFIIGDEDRVGPEVVDAELLDFPAEELDVTVSSNDGRLTSPAEIYVWRVDKEHQSRRCVSACACKRENMSGRCAFNRRTCPRGKPGCPCNRLCRPTHHPHRPCFRGARHFPWRAARLAGYPCRQDSAEPQCQRRCAYSRAVARMAPLQASHIRASASSGRMADG